MDVRIVRDDRVAPGGEGTVELPGEILFFVSAAGVSEDGAETLEDGWRWFIQRGIWRYGEPGGEPVTTCYRRAPLPADVVVRLSCSSGIVECILSPEHFTQGSANGLQVAARASVKGGWRYYSPAVRHARAS